MSDRELLELAAGAAGIELLDFGTGAILVNDDEGHTAVWDPLNDDGDALRLAVELEIDVIQRRSFPPEVWTQAPLRQTVIEPVDGDEFAATRRAIVRAAAEIGRRV